MTDVSKAVLITGWPKARYPLTASAHLIMGQRRLFSDRMWDRFAATNFPRPGK